jgi:2-(1,2-epoxy-1,2-dihydrophenyl)acetyl-CoA isomerase
MPGPLTGARAVGLESRDGVGWVTLDRPAEGNSLDLATLEALEEAVAAAESAGVGVLVLGATGRFFSVGGDLNAFAAAPDRPALIDAMATVLHRVVSRLTRMDAIVVAAVQGPAAGAGLSLAAACDLLVAAESATFTLAYTAVGLSADGGSTATLAASLGVHHALRLALLNAPLTAEQARDAGLVAAVHPDAEFEAAVASLAHRLAGGPRRAQAEIKHLIREAAGVRGLESQLEREARGITAAAGDADSTARIGAFLSRRAAG